MSNKSEVALDRLYIQGVLRQMDIQNYIFEIQRDKKNASTKD